LLNSFDTHSWKPLQLIKLTKPVTIPTHVNTPESLYLTAYVSDTLPIPSIISPAAHIPSSSTQHFLHSIDETHQQNSHGPSSSLCRLPSFSQSFPPTSDEHPISNHIDHPQQTTVPPIHTMIIRSQDNTRKP
jgi:hypothetical protein